MMITEQAGEFAGRIWTALNETEGLTLKEIKKETKLKEKELYLGLGWLLREDKVFSCIAGEDEIFAASALLRDVVAQAKELGFKILGLTFSPVKGPAGNIEFLGHLTLQDVEGIEPDTADVVAQAHKTLD